MLTRHCRGLVQAEIDYQLSLPRSSPTWAADFLDDYAIAFAAADWARKIAGLKQDTHLEIGVPLQYLQGETE